MTTMQPDFWHDRWQKEMIGFHQTETNRNLVNHIGELNLAPGDTVFLPLCGKSLDMWWLHEQGYKVIGIELSEIAINAFFSEAGQDACRNSHDGFESWKYADVEIIRGDFFDLNADIPGKVDAVFDRASLIALPPEMRLRYLDHLATMLVPGTRGLLVTLEYPQSEMSGPPFSVTEQEVNELYADSFNIALIEDCDALGKKPQFQQRGLTSLHEKVYLFERV